MSQPPPSPPILPAPSPAPMRYLVLAPSLLLILFGVSVLALIAYLEYRWVKQEAWTEAIVTPANVLEAEDAVALWARSLPRDTGPEDPLLEAIEQMQEMEGIKEARRLTQPEHLLAVELSTEALQPLLAEGRLPKPGQREVLMGPLARFEEFRLDGEKFKVVGRLKPTVSGFVYSYLMPYDEALAAHFSEGAGGTRGSLVIKDGVARLPKLLRTLPEEADSPEILGGQTLTRPSYAWGTLFALVLVALGGMFAHQRLFRLWAPVAPEVFQGILRETLRFRHLFIGMHALLYSIFLGSMVLGLEHPLFNYWMTHFISDIFREGGLSYIGDAYASGNITMAALATFQNNYIIQTLGLTFLTSILPLGLGVLKTALSFMMVGFAMAPVWVGTASGLVFHCITMVLELEAYILACFAITAWAYRIWRLIFNGPDKAEFIVAVRMFVGAMVLTGVMLALAAIYEAVTLIQLRPYL